MSKNKVEIDVTVDDKGTTKKVGLEAKKTAGEMDKASKSAGTLDRNMKGAGQASSGATKNFSKMSQGMGGLVGTYATLAATVFAVSAAFQFLKSAADFKNLVEGQKALGTVTGVAYKSISNSIVEATNGQLKYAEAAKAAAIGTASGISPSQLSRLGKAATFASIALGRDLGDSFDRLIRGVTKAEPELLDELGIILRLDTATAKYGLKIGKAANQLNEFERSQAVANEVLEQAERKFGALEALMDPNAAALNQFSKAFDDIVNTVKNGISGPIASIATFLSENIIALIGTLSLFATSVLKQILPSMSAWKDSSIKAGEAAKASQKALQVEIEKSTAAYVALQKAQQFSANPSGVTPTTSATLKGVAGSKTGTGTIDFLQGTTTSKYAQNSAERSLIAAEKQLTAIARGEAVKRTGILANFNAAQVADMRISYDARAAIIKKGEVDFKASTLGMKLSFSSFILTFKAGIASMRLGLASLATGMAALGVAVGAAFFWVSTIALVGSLLYELVKYIFPASEAEKKLAKDTEELTEKYKLLGEEINRTADYLKKYDSVTVDERTIAMGNAFTSLDIEELIENINALDKNAKGYNEVKEKLLNTTRAASKLDNEFAGLTKSIQSNTKISEESAAAYINLSNKYRETQQTLEKLPAAIQLVQAEFVKLFGELKKPFAYDYLRSLDTLIAQHTQLSIAAAYSAQEQRASIDAFNRSKTTKRRNSAHAITNKDQGVTYLPGKKEELEGMLKLQTDLNDKAKEEGRKAQELVKLKIKILTPIQDRLRLEKEIADNQLEAAKQRTLGITYEQKIANLKAEEITKNEKLNRLQIEAANLQAQKIVSELALADERAAQEAAYQKLAKTLVMRPGFALPKQDLSMLNAINDQIEGNKKLQGVETALISLEDKRRELAQNRLALENQAAIALGLRLPKLKEIADAERQINFIKAGGTGSFGVARAREAEFAFVELQRKKFLDAQQEEADALKYQTDQKIKFGENLSQADINTAQQRVNASKAVVAQLRQEIALYGMRAEEQIRNAKAGTEELRNKLENLSINPALTRFNEQMTENRKIGLDLSEEEQKALYAQYEAQMFLNEALEMKSGIFSSLTDNISGAFSSIVDGTKTAKQAFGDMAIAILKDLSQMIIRMMVMRALSSFFFPSITSNPAVGMTDMPALLPGTQMFAKTGGVFSEGKKVPGYAVGGVARGSSAGYPAVLHGTEAVVPLPNGRSIPVEMKNGSAQNNNVVVNVSVDSQGRGQTSTESQSGTDAGNLGNAIAKAVQQELQNQKRSGGILNPYGVA